MLSSRPGSPSATRTSPSTDADPLAGEGWAEDSVAVAEDPEAGSAAGNGSWDPLSAVMAAETPLPSDTRSRLGDKVEELKFTRLSEAATLPTRAHDGDAGLDLYAAEAARIGPGQRVSVGTGLAVAIPQGLAGLVTPRSGLALKHGIALVNAPGVIDSGYRGELRVLLLNTDATAECRIAAGDRVAQLLLVPIATASPLEADTLEGSERGAGGFGSSGA